MNPTALAHRVLICATIVCGTAHASDDSLQHQRCKRIRADLTEMPATTGCIPPATSCFLGEIDGNHGLRGTTHFAADSARAGPATSPDFISYSGVFEYTTARGTLTARETGVTNPSTGQPQSGAITAYQQIIAATGDYTGYSGYLFVSGRRVANVITTEVSGELCRP